MKAEVKTFNRAFKVLLKELKGALPDEPGMCALMCGFRFLKHAQPGMPRKLFHQLVALPHASRVRDRDLQFFLDTGFTVEGFEETCAFFRRVCSKLPSHVMDRVWSQLAALLDIDAHMRPPAPAACLRM
jgi:hypothetical protein